MGQEEKCIHFVNEVKNQLIDSSLSYFYLDENIAFISYKQNELNKIENQLKDILSEMELIELLSSIRNDTTRFIWKRRAIDKAKTLNSRRKEKAFKRISKEWNRAQISQRNYLKLDELEYFELRMSGADIKPEISLFLRLSEEKQNVFIFGKPYIISNFALMEFAFGKGRMTMSGHKCLFKKIDGKWMLVKKFDSWAS